MRARSLTVLRLAGAAAVLTVAYYLIPARGRLSTTSWSALFAVGAAVLAALVLLLVGGLLRAGPDVRLQRLFVMLCLTVFFFADAYYLLSQMPGQIDDAHTKTDTLYFTITTLSTVGYGDVHAAGQLARIAVTIQIIFDLFFIGTAVAVAGGILRTKAARLEPRHGQHPDKAQPGTTDPSPPKPGPGPARRGPDEQ